MFSGIYAVTGADLLRIGDEVSLQYISHGIRNSVGSDALVKDSNLLNVLRIIEAPGNSYCNAVGHPASKSFP